jgi:DedD protein
MDRALKERIVGATVLVVIAVLVVPVFLDGPADEPELVTEPVTLPGQADRNTKRQTIVLERDREEPVPAAGGSAREARQPAPSAPEQADKEAPASTARQQSPPPDPVPQPAQQPAREPPAESKAAATNEAAKPPATVSATTTESATGMWAVQLGSFSSQPNAERLAAELRKAGYAAFLSRVQTSSEVLHRVRVGPQQNRESAEQVAARLGSDGHKGQVVPHP